MQRFRRGERWLELHIVLLAITLKKQKKLNNNNVENNYAMAA
jgi:hypothetical protein